MYNFFYLFVFFIAAQPAIAQNVLRGKVTDGNNGADIPAVSIYINNSSKGTSTNTKGEYLLSNITVVPFDLVATCIGYETFSVTITGANLLEPFNIKLKQKSAELQAVIIQRYEKDGWNKWGKTFKDNLIGSMDNAADCEIVNYKTVKFVYDKKQNLLTAFADEPLIIVNKFLGYELKFDLQNFSTNFKTKLNFYEGFPFFTQLSAKPKKIIKWKRHRENIYSGSILHFMRSVYRNTLEQEGFEIRVLKRYPNVEKQRVKKMYSSLIDKTNGVITIRHTDSTEYYNKILGQSDSMDYVYKEKIKADSIAYQYDKTTAGLSFDNHIQVWHNSLVEDYTKPFHQDANKKIHPTSIISIINAIDIFVYANGSCYHPISLFTEGYWGYSEKLCNLLPIDYVVGD